MTSPNNLPFANKNEDTCQNPRTKLCKCCKDRRFHVNENPESIYPKKTIGYVIELTARPQSNKREKWQKGEDCGFSKSPKRNKKDHATLPGGDNCSKTAKGPSGDHRLKKETRKEKPSQTKTTTKYVKVTSDIIQLNEIMLSKLRRNEELLQQIKKHKDMINLLKTKIRDASSRKVSKTEDRHEDNLKNKVKKQPGEKPVPANHRDKNQDPVITARNLAREVRRKLRKSTLPDIKERPEPVDSRSVKSILSKLIHASNGMEKLSSLQKMYGATMNKQAKNELIDCNIYNGRPPTSPRYHHPLSIIRPNTRRVIPGTPMTPTLQPVVNFIPMKKPILARRKKLFHKN